MNKKQLIVAWIRPYSIGISLLVFILSSSGCVFMLAGTGGIFAVNKMQSKQTSVLEEELAVLEKDYKDGKINADTYWQARANLVSEMESIKTQKEIARSEAFQKSISSINIPEQKEPAGPQRIRPIKGIGKEKRIFAPGNTNKVIGVIENE